MGWMYRAKCLIRQNFLIVVIKDPLSEKDLDLPVQSPGLVIGGAPSTSPKSFLCIDIIILQLNKCTNLAFIKISSLV